MLKGGMTIAIPGVTVEALAQATVLAVREAISDS